MNNLDAEIVAVCACVQALRFVHKFQCMHTKVLKIGPFILRERVATRGVWVCARALIIKNVLFFLLLNISAASLVIYCVLLLLELVCRKPIETRYTATHRMTHSIALKSIFFCIRWSFFFRSIHTARTYYIHHIAGQRRKCMIDDWLFWISHTSETKSVHLIRFFFLSRLLLFDAHTNTLHRIH